MILALAVLVGVFAVQVTPVLAQCSLDSGNLLKNSCFDNGKAGPFEAWTGSRAIVDTTHGEAFFTIVGSGSYDDVQLRQDFDDAGYNQLSGQMQCDVTASQSGIITFALQDAGPPFGYRGLWVDYYVTAGQTLPVMLAHKYTGSGPLRWTAFLGAMPNGAEIHMDNVKVIALNPNGQFMNGGFETGIVPWVSQLKGTGSFTLYSPGCVGMNSGRVTVTTPGLDWENQIRQENLQLASGGWQLNVTANCMNAPVIEVEVSWYDGTNWHGDVSENLSFTLGSCQTQSVNFTIADPVPKRTLRLKFPGAGTYDLDVDLGHTTPALPMTWGGIKALYRSSAASR